MILPIAAQCTPTRAGIRSLFLLPCRRLNSITYATDGRISAIDITCEAGTGWTEYRFRRDTASFDQVMGRSGMNTPTNQTISFQVDGVTNALRLSVVSLKKNCCLLVVVRDAAGLYMLAGVSSYRDGVETRDLRLSALSATTGQDSAADINTATFTLSATVNCLAPYLTASPVDISTDCGAVIVYGPVEDGDVAWGPVEDGDTAWGPVQH